MPKVNEPGQYYGEIVSGVLIVEHNKPCYVVDFSFDSAKGIEVKEKLNLTKYFYLSTNNGERNNTNISSVMKVTGWNGLDLRELKSLDPSGVRVWVPVVEDRYDGKMFYKANSMRLSGDGKRKSAEGNKFEAISDAWVSGEVYVVEELEDDVPF